MASDPTHALEVYGQVFVEGTEGGRRSQRVPFEIYSDYTKDKTDNNFETQMKLTSNSTSGTESSISMQMDYQDGKSFYMSRNGARDFGLDNDRNAFFNGETDFGVSNIYSQNADVSNYIGKVINLSGSTVTIEQFVAGVNNSFIIDTNGRLYSAGDNTYGQLGLGFNTLLIQTYTQCPFDSIAISRVIKVSASYASTSIISDDGSVWSTGRNDYGQLADGTNVAKNTFTAAVGAGTSGAIDVTCGTLNTIILKNDGSIWGAGRDHQGQLGIGGSPGLTYSTFTAAAGAGASGVAQVSAGPAHTMIVKTDGSVWGCGFNGGRLGFASPTQVSTFTAAVGAGASDVTQVSSGSAHTMIIKTDSSVWGTGRNNFGQLGLGAFSGGVSSFTAAVDAGSSDVTQVSAGSYHTMILKNDGSVWGTGNNDFGQLANTTIGLSVSSFNETEGEGETGVTEITTSRNSAGGDFSGIVKSNKIYGAGYPPYVGYGGGGSYTTFTDPNNYEIVDNSEILIDSGTNSMTFKSNINIISTANVGPNGKVVVEYVSTGIPYLNLFTYQDIDYTSNYNVFFTGGKLQFMSGIMSINDGATVSTSGGYSPFTGTHYGISTSPVETGMIVSVNPEIKPKINSINEVIVNVKKSDLDNDPNVYGVSTGGSYFNAVGEGGIWVCDIGGTLSSGDYISSSSLSGYGKRQYSEFMTNYTVGKILGNCNFTGDVRYLSVTDDNSLTIIDKSQYLTETDSVYRAKLVGCTYHCG